jgi:hypothetical protein
VECGKLICGKIRAKISFTPPVEKPFFFHTPPVEKKALWL